MTGQPHDNDTHYLGGTPGGLLHLAFTQSLLMFFENCFKWLLCGITFISNA